ncbi:hypothetical protein FB446DRAFT_745253 [Lentinula raphanica]|nr:hypothetical protein FB446DRAFT_745253 [Lentinula raphanica]
MHSNSSVFYALMCLSAILHIVCGSPVPQAPSSARSDRGRNPSPLGQSTSNGDPIRPSKLIVKPAVHEDLALHPSIPFEFLTPLLDNHARPSIYLYARIKLRSQFPEIDVPPDDAVDYVHIDHSSGKDPLPLMKVPIGDKMLEMYLYDFGPPAGSAPSFLGTAHISLVIEKGQDGHPKVDRSRSAVDIYINGYPRSYSLLRIGPDEPYHFVDSDPDDPKGAGLKVVATGAGQNGAGQNGAGQNGHSGAHHN